MESYIPITYLNDFTFCPRSIYFHNIYQENYSEDVVHRVWQKDGQAAHKAIDEQKYSRRENIIQAMSVYSVRYNLMGKIDLFYTDTGLLVERKNSVTAIYPGFRYQLYAQYFCLHEMGYHPQKLQIYSKKNNKTYPVSIPRNKEIEEFETLLSKIRSFSLSAPFRQAESKCIHCIYNPLCDYYQS